MNSQLLEKFYQNKCTPEEVKQVLSWFEQENPGQDQQQAMQAIWQEADNEVDSPSYAHNPDKIFDAILAKKAASEAATAEEEIPVRELYPQPWKNYLKLAAAVLLPLCFVWLLTSKYQQNNSAQFVTVEARPGVKKTITLADGSTVKLHSGSTLTYPESFGATREVSLTGEAFFEVTKDSLRPFIVRTGQLSTKVLGTSFNISSQDKDSTIRVALATGIVKIEQSIGKDKAQQLALLEPGQQLVHNKLRNSHKIAQFDQAQVLSWKDGVLYFKDASLPEVVAELERWYGVKIEIQGMDAANAAANWHYTGKYNRQSIESVLQGISFVKKFSYSKTDSNNFILSLNKKP